MICSISSLRRYTTCMFLLAVVFSRCGAADSSSHIPILDENGREIIPGGYVLITEDPKGPVNYTPDDYKRMVRMGANFQVIRTTLGRLGGWPGRKGDPNYLKQIDGMVQMGKDAELKTVFKMVVYDLRPFGRAGWDAIWNNTNGSRDAVLDGWKKLWVKYKDEPSVFGYDLLNEPQRGFDLNDAQCARQQLLPTLRRFADEMHAISPDKWALFQPLYKANGQPDPFEAIKEPFGRNRIIYAPHLYSMNRGLMIRMLDKYENEARLCGVPLMLGEWGPATNIEADSDPEKQKPYTGIYEITANAIDQRNLGAIKAWFCGTRVPLKTRNRPPFTWAIFSDKTAVGHVERKFITDAIARPKPLTVAGRIISYGYDFKSKVLEISLKPDASHGSSELFVPKERFYADGFRISIDSGLEMMLKSVEGKLQVVKAADKNAASQGKEIYWDKDKQHIFIRKWATSPSKLNIKIAPL